MLPDHTPDSTQAYSAPHPPNSGGCVATPDHLLYELHHLREKAEMQNILIQKRIVLSRKDVLFF